jgi:hypothetical protein
LNASSRDEDGDRFSWRFAALTNDPSLLGHVLPFGEFGTLAHGPFKGKK